MGTPPQENATTSIWSIPVAIYEWGSMLEITLLGHGTFQLRLSTGEVFLMDPWIEGNPSYPA
jgi:hypothetical protein